MSETYTLQRDLDLELLKAVMPEVNPETQILQLAQRVAEQSLHFEPQVSVQEITEKFASAIFSNHFLPTPTVLLQGLQNDTVLFRHVGFRLKDDFDDIFSVLQRVSVFLQQGVQVAVDFSGLHAARASIQKSNLQTLGPIRFMEFFERAPQPEPKTAQKFILRIDHLDVLDFLAYITKAPPSLEFCFLLTGEFLAALARNQNYELSVFGHIVALLAKGKNISFVFPEKCHQYAQRYHLSSDLVLNHKGQLTQAGESQSFGTLNLTHFVDRDGFLEEKLKQNLRVAIHFLDNLFEMSAYVDEENRRVTKQNRRLGLSLLGLGEVLQVLNPEQSVPKTQKILANLSQVLQREGIRISQKLGERRGATQQIYFDGKKHTTRHAQIFAQVSLPFLEKLADTPAYFTKRGMTKPDVWASLDWHRLWQQENFGMMTFGLPQKMIFGAEDLQSFLQQAYESQVMAFEIN